MSADASRSDPGRQPGRRPPAPAAALLCLLAAGCAPPRAADDGPEPAAPGAAPRPAAEAEPAAGAGDAAAPREGTFRGLYVAGPAVRSFTACGAARAVWLTDRTGGQLDEVYRALAARPYQPVFVEFQGYPLPPPPEDGFGTEYEARVSALALRHAAAPADVAADAAAACRDDLGGAALRAVGDEPRWRLDVAESGIALTLADAVRDTVFPYAPPEESAPGRRVFAAVAAEDPDGPPRRIEVVIEERPCTDSASGAYFSLAAEVRLDDGRTLTGCARENWR